MWKLSRVQLFVTPWTVAFQAPLSMEFSRHKYCSGLLFPFIWFPFHIKRNMSFSLFLSFLSWKLLCILVLRVNELPPGFLLAGPSRWFSGKDPPRDQCSIQRVGKRKWEETQSLGWEEDSCLENSMDRGASCATVHGVAKSWTPLSDWAHSTFYVKTCL